MGNLWHFGRLGSSWTCWLGRHWLSRLSGLETEGGNSRELRQINGRRRGKAKGHRRLHGLNGLGLDGLDRLNRLNSKGHRGLDVMHRLHGLHWLNGLQGLDVGHRLDGLQGQGLDRNVLDWLDWLDGLHGLDRHSGSCGSVGMDIGGLQGREVRDL